MTKRKRTRRKRKKKRILKIGNFEFDRWDIYWWIEYLFFTIWISFEVYVTYFVEY